MAGRQVLDKQTVAGWNAATSKSLAIAVGTEGELEIGFVASVDLVIEPSANYKSVSAAITATSYPGTAQAVFGFTSRNIVIANDSVQDVTFSFNGTTNDTVIKAGEVVTFDEAAQTQVFFKVAAGSSAVRVLVT